MSGKVLPFAGSSQAKERPSEELLALCAQGEPSALGLLFDRHSPAVYRFVSRLVGSGAADLDDLVQLTFLEVWRSADGFRGESSTQTWIFSIAANICRHFFRGEGRRRKMTAHLATRAVELTATPENNTSQQELLVRLEQAVSELPESLRVPFVMVYVEELPGVEVAKVLQIPSGTLWRRLHEARQKIRQYLEEDPNESRDMSLASRAITGLFGRGRS